MIASDWVKVFVRNKYIFIVSEKNERDAQRELPYARVDKSSVWSLLLYVT